MPANQGGTMSAMKNLDLMIQQTVTTPDDYEDLKTQINMHISGEIQWFELTQQAKDILHQWEIEEMELESNEPTDEDIEAWEKWS